MTKLSYCQNPEVETIIYYCNNHRLNTVNKRNIFKNNPCNGKIEYNRKNKNFYLVSSHNNLCDTINFKIYDNMADISSNVNNFTQYKNELKKYLDSHPLILYKTFKYQANILYTTSEFDFILKENILKIYIKIGEETVKYFFGHPYMIITKH